MKLPLPPLLLLVWLGPSANWTPCVAASPGAPVPWTGLLGFLQTFARIQEEPQQPDESADGDNDSTQLRKIVYAVEEQILPGDPGPGPGLSAPPASEVIYDSACDSCGHDAVEGAGARPPQQPNATDTYSLAQSAQRSLRERREFESRARAARAAPSDTPTHGGELSSSAASTGAGAGPRNAVTHHGKFLGRKLWYVPLWFSVYFILYLTALVVKSVAQHRIKYPTLVPEGELGVNRRRGSRYRTVTGTRTRPRPGPGALSRRVAGALDSAAHKYRRK